MQMISDGMFFKCITDTVDLHRRYSKSPVYTYYYAHRGLFTFPMLYLTDDNNVELGNIMNSFYLSDSLNSNWLKC